MIIDVLNLHFVSIMSEIDSQLVGASQPIYRFAFYTAVKLSVFFTQEHNLLIH